MLQFFEYERIADGIRILGLKGELEDIVIPEGVVEIADLAFTSAEIETVHFPRSLLRIGSNAFSECGFLRRISFPQRCRLRKIGSEAFRDTILTELKLPSELEKIGDKAFLGCEYLEEIKFPSGCGLLEIGRDAFLGCESLFTIYMPSSIPDVIGIEEYRSLIVYERKWQ